MCTIKLKNELQKIMLADAVKHEIENWESHKTFVLGKGIYNAPQTAELIDKRIAELEEMLALLEEK